ncbi:hypothetical protein KCTC52924_03700 [Arenibacter antarcticus]
MNMTEIWSQIQVIVSGEISWKQSQTFNDNYEMVSPLSTNLIFGCAKSFVFAQPIIFNLLVYKGFLPLIILYNITITAITKRT